MWAFCPGGFDSSIDFISFKFEDLFVNIGEVNSIKWLVPLWILSEGKGKVGIRSELEHIAMQTKLEDRDQ